MGNDDTLSAEEMAEVASILVNVARNQQAVSDELLRKLETALDAIRAGTAELTRDMPNEIARQAARQVAQKIADNVARAVALRASPSRPPVCFTSEASLALKPASSAEGPKVRRLAAGGGSLERTRLWRRFPGYREKYRDFWAI
jgi:hypothetical protein